MPNKKILITIGIFIVICIGIGIGTFFIGKSVEKKDLTKKYQPLVNEINKLNSGDCKPCRDPDSFCDQDFKCKKEKKNPHPGPPKPRPNRNTPCKTTPCINNSTTPMCMAGLCTECCAEYNPYAINTDGVCGDLRCVKSGDPILKDSIYTDCTGPNDKTPQPIPLGNICTSPKPKPCGGKCDPNTQICYKDKCVPKEVCNGNPNTDCTAAGNPMCTSAGCKVCCAGLGIYTQDWSKPPGDKTSPNYCKALVCFDKNDPNKNPLACGNTDAIPQDKICHIP